MGLRLSGEVANPTLDAGIVLQCLVMDTTGGRRHCWQRIRPFAAWVGGQAVEESAVAIPRLERESQM
jgi:hypothetical protein